MKSSKSKRNNIISIILTVIVISMYLFPNFASAVQVLIQTDKSTYDATDDIITFNMSVDIESGEIVPIQNITLKINNTYKTCTFLPNGTFLTSCTNLVVTANYVAPTSYGYGYGYGVDTTGTNQSTYFGYGYGYGTASGRTGYSGELTYTITWNMTADNATNGAYTASLDVLADDNGNAYTYSSTSANFDISKDSTAPTSIINQPANNTWTTDTTPEINFTLTDNNDTTLDYTIFIDDTAGQTGTVNNNTLTTLNLTSLTNAAHTIKVQAADSAGNKVNSSSITLKVDNTAPNITAFTLSDTTPTKNKVVTGTCSATDNSESFGGSVSTAITGINTSSTGTKTATCTATDSAGNTNTSTVSYTVRASSSTSGGTTTTTPNPQKTTLWGTASPSNPLKMNINVDELEVFAITFNVKETKNSVELKVEKLTEKPSSTVDPKGKVYQYLEITKKNLQNADLKGDANIEFKVKKSWLAENGLSKDDVVLKRYTTGWDNLPTNIESEDDEYVYFSAETPGFSFFAIGTKEKLTSIEEPEITITTPEVTTEPETTTEPEVTTEPVTPTSNAWKWILAVILVGIALYMYFKRPPKITHEHLKEHGVHEPHNNHEKLDNFIKTKLKEGHSKVAIKRALLKTHWKKSLIEEHLSKFEKP